MSTARTWDDSVTVRPVNMVTTVLVASNTDGQVFNLLLGNPAGTGTEAVLVATHTAASNTAAQIAQNLLADLQANNHEFARALTFTLDTATITITANIAGVPFVLTTTGSTGTLTVTNTVANEGPNDWGCASGWVEGKVPIDNDDVTVTGKRDIKYGLNQSGITLDTLRFVNYSGRVGTRGTPLIIEPEEDVIVDVSGQVNLRVANTVTVPRILCIRAGGQGYEYGLSVTQDSTAGTITSLQVLDGTVFLGLDRETGPTVTTLQVQGGIVKVFPSLPLTNILVLGGEVYFDNTNGLTLLRIDGGLVRTEGSSTITTVTQNGGTFISNSSGTITTHTLNKGVADYRQSRVARTVTTLTQDQPTVAYFDTATVTVSTHNRTGAFAYSGAGDATTSASPNSVSIGGK